MDRQEKMKMGARRAKGSEMQTMKSRVKDETDLEARCTPQSEGASFSHILLVLFQEARPPVVAPAGTAIGGPKKQKRRRCSGTEGCSRE